MIVLYVLAYLFVGTFVHWAADRLAKHLDNDDSLDTGKGFILAMLFWPIIAFMMASFYIPRALEDGSFYKSIHDFYDEIWNNLTS